MPHRLHDRALQRYAEHYGRVNAGIDPNAASPQALANMELAYGHLVRGLAPGSRVLDLGCGTGFLLRWLRTHAGLQVMGVDSSPTQVEVLRRALPGVEVTCQDGAAFLARHAGGLAGVFCIDVLEHLPDDDDCLALVESVLASLRPGGFFVCRVPNGANLTGGYSRAMDLTHHRVFTRTSLLQLLDAAGLAEASVLPVRASGLGGRLRQGVEHALHRLVYRLCGRGLETVFTANVCAVGFKR